MATLPRFLETIQTNDRVGLVGTSVNTSASGAVINTTNAAWWTEAEAALFEQWSTAFGTFKDSFNNPYFDYFYTGQDVQVTIDGLDQPEDVLPIYSFAYNIQQQKQPLYGYWSYTYDAMLRGTRIISGAFSIVSTAPYLLTQQIAKAADIRAKSTQAQRIANMHAIRGLDEDEALINQYWKKNLDSNLFAGQQHIFSVHPPFNFVIKYGLQQTSITHDSPNYRANDLRTKYSDSNAMMTDFNERLIENPMADLDSKILLENIEIVSKQIEFDSEGNPLLETYSFMARDEVLLHPVETSQLSVYNPDTAAITSGSSPTNRDALRPIRGVW